MHHIARLVVIVTALAGLTASRASAELLCQKKSGAVFARTTCKRHERVVTSSADTNVASLQGELSAAQAAEAALQARVQALETLTAAFALENNGHTLRLKNLTGIELTEQSVCVGPDFSGTKIGAAHPCSTDADCQEICVNGATALLGHSCNSDSSCNSTGAADGKCGFRGSCAAPAISLQGSDWTFSAVNVHVVDGRGAQDFRANGLGT